MIFRLSHLLAALLLHVLLFGLLAGGLQCSKTPVRPPVIQAVLLDPDRKQTAQQKRADERQRAEQRRQAEAEKKRQDADARRKAEQERQRREAEVRKQQLADEARRKKAEDQRKKAEDLQRQKELAEQKKAEEQARRKQQEQEKREQQEQAQREIQDKARMEQAMREETLRREAEREAAARAATEREARLSEWALLLSRHVQKYWIRPVSATDDFSCKVDVELLPDGSVVNARVTTSCGSAALDRSVQDAVYRASPLPRPADPSTFDRNLSIIFVPR